jgi:hypothetical protein
MSDIERRIAAVELVLAELVPWINEDMISDACAAIRAGLHTDLSAHEREVRVQALQLLTDGRRRYDPITVRSWITRG